MWTVKKKGLVCPVLEQCEVRLTPSANCYWRGTINTTWGEPGNWQGGIVPGPDDNVYLTGTADCAPSIAEGTNVVINYIQMFSVDYNLEIEGTLYTKGSLIRADGHGFVGSGTLNLDNTLAADPDDSWQTGFVTVKTVNVRDGAVLEVQSGFGQLGPVKNHAGSIWTIGGLVGQNKTPGTLNLNGDHFVGFEELLVEAQGTLNCVTGGTLTVVPPPEGQQWAPFNVVNLNNFAVYENQAETLTGGLFSQFSGTSNFRPGSSLAIGRFDGSSFQPAYGFSVGGGAVNTFQTVSISSNQADIFLGDSSLNFYSPGIYSIGGVQQTASTLSFRVMDGMNAGTTTFRNMAINFLDYNPAGRYSSAVEAGGLISILGNAKIDGTTTMATRVDLGQNAYDRIQASNTMTLGDAVALSMDLRDDPGNLLGFNVDGVLTGVPLDNSNNPAPTVSLTGAGSWAVAHVNVDMSTVQVQLAYG